MVRNNPSEEMIVMYTDDFHGFIQRIIAPPKEGAGILIGDIAENGDELMARIQDRNGYFWLIRSHNQLPAQVINAYNDE